MRPDTVFGGNKDIEKCKRILLTLGSIPQPQTPGFVKDRRFQPVHVVLLQGVVAVVEEGELVVDLRDPRVLTVILALSYLVNLLLKLLQACVVIIIMRGKLMLVCGGW